MNLKTLSDDQLLAQTSSVVDSENKITASVIQSFLYAEKRLDREYSTEAKLELVETCTGKSVREVQKEFVRRNHDRVRVSHSISNQLEEKLQRIKLLSSHVDPNMSREQMLDRMADLTLEQIDPLLKAKRAEKRKEKLEAEKRESAKPICEDQDRAS